MKTFTTYRLLLVVFLISASFTSYTQVHRYVFNNNLNEDGSGPALNETLAANCGASAGTFLANQTIKTVAGTCSGTSNVFSFTAGGGLSYPNASGFIQSSYTIHTFFQFNDYSTGYARIIDFSNSASDNGIYTLSSCLNFYPNGNVGTCPYFINGNYYLLSLVRDGATNQMKVFVNGSLFSTYTDASNHYKPTTATTPIIFFRDDNFIQCEVEPGQVRYISLSPAVSTDSEIASIWDNICSAITTLPLNLTSFNANKVSDSNVKLTWSTSNEKNAGNFLVERSTDSKNFSAIGKVNANNTSINHSYNFTDSKPMIGDNYYRLKQVDLDRKFTYSATRQVNITKSGIFAQILYNAGDKNIYITSSNSWLKGTAILFSANSQVLKKTVIQKSVETLDISNLPPGIYFLRIQKESDVVTRKIVKM